MWPFKKRNSLKDSGIFKGFTDWHSHILPGVDDGVQTMEESLEILLLYESLGVAEVWLTPHIMEDIPNTTDALRERFAALQAAYSESYRERSGEHQGNGRDERSAEPASGSGPDERSAKSRTVGGPVKLHLAAENMLDSLFEERLAANDLLPLGEAGDHLLVETSYFNPPMGLHGILESIKAKGYYPVLAHPERYVYMEERDYRHLKQMGVKLQLNLFSLQGLYGEAAQKKAMWLQKQNMYDYTGTDLHRAEVLKRMLEAKL